MDCNFTPIPRYEDYTGLIAKAAWARRRTNPDIELEELMAAGSLSFVEALRTWKPVSGAFSTHLTNRLKNELGRTVRHCIKHRHIDIEDVAEASDHKVGFSSEMFGPKRNGGPTYLTARRVAEDAREVVDLVLGSAGEFCDFTLKTVKVTQANVKRYLMSLGWGRRRVNEAINEIKETLREI